MKVGYLVRRPICGKYQNEIDSILESAKIQDIHFIYVTCKNRNKMAYLCDERAIGIHLLRDSKKNVFLCLKM